jgi:hypothetical protein
MKKLKKWCLISIASLLSGFGVLWACGGGDWYILYNYEYTSLIQSKKYLDSTSIPLFKGLNEFTLKEDIDNNINRYDTQITNEWYSYLNGALPKETIKKLLLDDDYKPTIEKLYSNINNPSYSFNYISLKTEKVRSFIQFLQIAKEVEQYAITPIYSWEENARDKYLSTTLLRKVEGLYEGFKGDAFLKNRFWFQAMKANFYSADKKNAIYFFEKSHKEQPKNTLYYRAVSYVGGAYYAMKDFATSNARFAKVFANEPTLKAVAIRNFHPEDEQMFKASVDACENKEDVIALWALLGYYAHEMRAIEAIYALDPQNKNLQYLAAIYLLELEASFNYKNATDVASYKAELKSIVKQQDWKIIEQIANDNKTLDKAFWFNIVGYLNMLDGKYDNAKIAFEKSFQHTNKSQDFADQLKILNTVNQLLSFNDMSKSLEQQMLEPLSWLFKKIKTDNYWEYTESAFTQKNHYYFAKIFAKQYLYKLYLKSNNPIFAQLVAPTQEYYTSASNQEAILSVMNDKKMNTWTKLLVDDYRYTRGQIYYLQGLLAAWDDNMTKAYELMKKASAGHLEMPTLLADPFLGNIQDCNDCDIHAHQKEKYSAQELYLRMYKMQNELKNGKTVYNNAILLGNAFYNISYFGNARDHVISNPIIIAGYLYADVFYKDKWLSMDNAKKYYTIALQNARNDEEKAKAHYMLSKVERNEYYTSAFANSDKTFGGFDRYYNRKENEKDFVAGVHFKALSTLSNTQYYKDVIQECGYFKTYIKSIK